MSMNGSSTSMRVHTPQLEDACLQAIQGIRASLIELYSQAGLDPEAPQDVSRKYKLNKNLTWKLSKVIAADDGFSAIPHLPGSSGWDIFLNAMTRAGVSSTLLGSVREACGKFDDFVTLHAGDRANLELILDSMGVGRSSANPMEASRELAYQGNSGIWGVQARVRTATGFVSPGATDDKLDISLTAGFVGFRQLRSGVSWPLFRFQTYSDNGQLRPRHGEPIEPSPREGDPPNLIRSFCSANLPSIAMKERADETLEFCLNGGQIGNLGAFNCFFGDIARGYPRYATPEDSFGEFGSTIVLPVETMVFDVFIHRSIRLDSPPEVVTYGHAGYHSIDTLTPPAEARLPLTERCTELPGNPPVVATTHIPNYTELVQTIAKRFDRTLAEFVGYRVVMKYPPMPSTMRVRWPLERAPR